jgi:hypothetical protein
MVLSGGYQKSNSQAITSSLINLNEKFGLLKNALLESSDPKNQI